MKITLSASRIDIYASGNTQVISIDCDETEYKEALKIIENFCNKK